MEIESALQYLKLLANETRLRLLGLLAQRERSVGEVAEILGLREPTISHHLAKLSEAGLVEMRAEGTVHFYRLDGDALQRLGRELFAPGQVTSLAGTEAADAWERKVLDTYLQSGRLSRIPATRKKRDVVLRWLVARFEDGRRYPEREVNETIQQFHPDSATLRRELIMTGLMQRENGLYWRLPAGTELAPGGGT
ncbi:MAG TPA: metalloregulator ArsR/SmtB family transcription factor [Longimicrobiaceae bacterium]